MSRRHPIRITGARPDECPTCEGCGETAATCREMATVDLRGLGAKLRTTRMGSGCPDCLGTGKRVIAAVMDCVPFVLPKRFLENRGPNIDLNTLSKT